MPHILVVEDEAIIRNALRRLLERHHYQVSEAGAVHEAVEQYVMNQVYLMIGVLRLPGEPATELIRKAAETAVLIMTNYASLRSAVDSMKLGAVDYIARPFEHDEMLQAVARIIETNRRPEQTERETPVAAEGPQDMGIIGASPAMQTLFKRIRK